MPKDYYTVLSVARNATPDEIRECFRQLARERHPDRFQGEERAKAEISFQELTEAFNVLSSPERRRQHDLELARPTAEPGSDNARMARFHLEAGVAFYREANYPAAAEAFERVVQLAPENHQAWHHLAQALVLQRRALPRAGQAIARACELNPVSPQYFKLAGRIHAELGNAEKAERYYNEAIALGGEDPTVSKALEELRARSKKGRSGLFGRGA
ncbi:MAG: DnaJ domain-containing protein [Thermoanaerobaculia bacterium]|nr:MAG: DnaJ domain-containing protein [Thermoanaerobaculia bacterium]